MRSVRPPGQRSTRRRLPPSPTSTSYSPFHMSAMDYLKAGFLPIPLPIGKKFPPPKGTPNELDVTEERVRDWLADPKPRNIGTIIPDGVVVYDIDGRPAFDNLLELENELGELPETWITFHGNKYNFHMWFRTDAEMRPGRIAPGIDLLTRHYRYAVLPPSIHPSGGTYRWAQW